MSRRPSALDRWGRFREIAREHRGRLVAAHLLAVLAVAATVPLPLLFPALVDEILLDQPGPVLPQLDRVLPEAWAGPTSYVLAILLLTVTLRLLGLAFKIVQEQQFTRISKAAIFRLRQDLLSRLGLTSMAEF
ncbi:MAG: ABC transporter ATP-binding protein, partial [Acidobacteriota bacterium]